MEKQQSLPSLAAQALEAHNSSKPSSKSNVPQSADEIKSLNQLLQWAAANSTEDQNKHTTKKNSETNAPNDSHPPRTEEQLKKDREWLDAAFPDVYDGLRQIIELLDSPDSSVRIGALQDLQEFFLDLNYAINIHKIGALEPIIRLAQQKQPQSNEHEHEHDDAEERAAAIWVLGTAMQHVTELKTLFVSHDVHKLISSALSSDNPPAVRAKAVMAASALLRNANVDIIQAFESVGGNAALRARLADSHVPTRRRARFFLMHAPSSGNQSFVESFITDSIAISEFSDSLKDMDVDDYSDVETAMGAIAVLIDENLQGLLQVAPELPSVLDHLIERCGEEDIAQMIRDISSKLP